MTTRIQGEWVLQLHRVHGLGNRSIEEQVPAMRGNGARDGHEWIRRQQAVEAATLAPPVRKSHFGTIMLDARDRSSDAEEISR